MEQKNTTLIIMSAGESSRFCEKSRVKKHWIRIFGTPLWLFVANELQNRYKFHKVIITANANEANYMRRFCDFEIVNGGKSRQESLQNALKSVKSEFVAVSDVARFGLDFAVLDRLFSLDLSKVDCAIPTLDVADTIFMECDGKKKYMDRSAFKLVQTPQISRLSILKEALKLGEFSDESSAINAFNGRILYIKGSHKLHKLTHFEDLEAILASLGDLGESSSKNDKYLQNPQDLPQNRPLNLQNLPQIPRIRTNLQNLNETFIGLGFDTHKFCRDKQMVLCGVKIKSEFGLEAHSDGDVALHALCDALLGGIGAGDIGEWFPPDDDSFKDVDSTILLRKVMDFVESVGFCVVNVDMMILAEIPKITPYKSEMMSTLSEILRLPKNRINIKATTMEQMGFVGRKEGICAKAVVSLRVQDLSL